MNTVSNKTDKPEAFVLTGAIPSNGNYVKEKITEKGKENEEGIEGKMKDGKINIPKTLWTAFCCHKGNGEWFASAHWGENVREDGDKKYLETKTLDELKTALGIQPFPGDGMP